MWHKLFQCCDSHVRTVTVTVTLGDEWTVPCVNDLQEGQPYELHIRYRDLLSIQTLATINAGFCDYHLDHCPPSQQLLDVCSEVRGIEVTMCACLSC